MLQRFALLTITIFSLQSFAGKFDFLQGQSGPQKEVGSLLESGNYRQAMMAWETAYRGSSFAQSNNGIATWAYLLYQNGLPFTALETLVKNSSPAKLDPSLAKLWTAELKNSLFIQKGWISVTGGWKSIVNNDYINIQIKNNADIAKAFARAGKLGADNKNEKARILWQIATQAPLINDVNSSLKALKLMRDSGQTVIGQDQLSMTQARVLYQKKDIAGALNAYNQVPKSSSLWIDSVEERAWAHLRQDDYDKAMGVITTALSPVLAPLAGPETYYLANLMAYRACDYARVFNTSELFKKRHHTRLSDIQELAQKGSNRTINQVFDRFEQSGVSQESAGSQVESMPRGLFHDRKFIQSMESRRELLGEIKKAGQLLEESKTLGANSELEKQLASATSQVERLKQEAYQRARQLAQADLKEYRVILNKMNIIEGEIIQRLHMDENLKGQRGKLSQNDDNKDALVFPVTDEVWMDELDNYKARVKDCPTLKGASL